MTEPTQLLSDLDILFSTDLPWVETVTYTAVGEDGASIPAIVRRGDSQEPYVRGVDFADATLSVKQSDVADPKYGDLFTVENPSGSDEVWELDRVMESKNGTHLISIERRA